MSKTFPLGNGHRFGDDISNQWPAGPDKNAYKPYFFAGSDVYVFVVNKDKDIIPIPVSGVGFGVSQQKVPIYGAWSYVYDAVANGTRIVQGQFSIVFTEVNFISKLIGPQKSPDKSVPNEQLDLVDYDDEIKGRALLRESLWTKTVDPNPTDTIYNPSKRSGVVYSKRAAFPFGRDPRRIGAGDWPEAMFSGHHSFDIMIIFGSNIDFIDIDHSNFSYEKWSRMAKDHMKMYDDINDGSLIDPKRSQRIYIEDVQLTSSGIAADVSGQPIEETYTFFARDVYAPVVE